MPSLEELQLEINKIKERNKRVETDKAWEISRARKVIILLLTYIVIVIFFYFARLPKPFINAIVPAIAFVLSTLTIPFFKKWWLKKRKRKNLKTNNRYFIQKADQKNNENKRDSSSFHNY